MPRPRKWRRVSCLPETDRFGPLNGKFDPNDCIVMTVDEYETIRLIDYEGCTQEECSKKMNVARTTIQGIYFEARRKISDALVNSKALWIQGGEYVLGEGAGRGPCCLPKDCPRRKMGCDPERCEHRECNPKFNMEE